MANNFGLSSLVQTFSPPLVAPPTNSPFIPVRVIDIILDDKNSNFENQGAWDSIGTIQFRPVYVSSDENNKDNFLFAKPFFSNLKHYPLKNEIVFIIFLPNQNTQNTFDGSYYYIDTVNVWSSIHHNALPDASNPENYSENQKRDYKDILAGATRRITDEGTDIKLGNTFKEKNNIHPLLPYEGDVIIEGRWGQSLRFGSTVNDSNIKNLWSSIGDNGNPITIIRNNQSSNVSKEGWVPILENINTDGSSIYMGSTQAIPIVVASLNQKSFNNIIQSSNTENIIIFDKEATSAPSESLSTSDNNLVVSANPTSPAISSAVTPDSLPDQSLNNQDELEFSLPGDVVELNQSQEIDTIDLNNLSNEIISGGENAPSDNPIDGNVPFEIQQDGVWCLIASCAMLLKYAGINITQRSIWSNFTVQPGVNNNLKWGKLFSSKGFKSTRKNIPGGQAGYNILLNQIKNSNTPFILERCRTSGFKASEPDKSHFVVVVGVTSNNKIIVNDPANKTGNKKILEISQLKPIKGSYITVNVPSYKK